MSALWLHLRSSPARWAVLPLAALGVAVLFGRNRFWMGIWPETGAAVQVSALFISLFAAGFAAWIAATVEVRGMHEQAASAAIRPFTVELTRFTSALILLLAPYLLVTVTALTTTMVTLSAPGIGTFFRYIALGVILIVFALAWGWLLGRLLTPLLAALCAVLSWFICASLLGDLADAAPVSGPPWFDVPLSSVAVRLAAVVLFALAVCLIPWRTGGWGVFGQRIIVAVVMLVVAVGAHLATTVIKHRTPVAKPLCVQGSIQYCLWPEHAKYVPMIEALDRRVAALPVRLPLPERVVDYALSGSTRWIDQYNSIELPGTFDPEFDISEGSRWALARGVASAIVGTVFAECDPNAQPDPQYRWDQLHAWLEWRLVGGGTPDYSTNAPQDMQAAWSVGHRVAAEEPEREQAAWVSTLIAEKKKRYCRAA